MNARWTPAFGAQLDDSGVTLRVCAPAATTLQASVGGRPPVTLTRVERDTFEGHVPAARAGERYQLRMDDHVPWPDPCSRWQPDGVHGPSMLIDPYAFTWSDAHWRGVPAARLVVYELHVGTFTPEGTFAAATMRLPELARLGVTAIELMPVAAFPGRRNWGYDGAALFAPSEAYGHPDDLRALVDRAHALGLAVLLDVVYNHLGPDGAYLAAYMPTVFTDRHQTQWGRGINLDGPGCTDVRRILCDNALHWMLEYHLDGLRLDATHALTDTSPEHILAQLSREVRLHVHDREIHLIAEDERNLASLVYPAGRGGAGLTGLWADDFHHAVRRHLAGDDEAWFADFTGASDEIARAVRDGWVFTGQLAPHYEGRRGTSPEGVPLEAPVICLQNHDQVGNRAHGDRLHHQVSEAAWLAATTLLLTAPETPLLFMGQEWAASSPFLYFTDHEEALGALVIEGRRREFRRFSAFDDPESRERIPSPQAERTWRRSQLDWEERDEMPHAHVLAETTALLAIRREHLSRPKVRAQIKCEAAGSDIIWLEQPSAMGGRLLTVVDLRGSGTCHVSLGCGSAHDDAARASGARVLHVTRPGGGAPTVTDIRMDSHTLVLDTTTEPFGVVLHLPGAGA
jgi:maltooligosyltrehalose trehalohydrolase